MSHASLKATLAASALALATSPTLAAFVAPNSWTRATGGTTYQHWDVFDSSTSDNTPDAGNVNANGQAVVTESTATGFLVGGNIYSPSAALDFTVTVPEADVPVPAHNATVIVQIATRGTELDYGSVLVSGVAATQQVELSRTALGGFGGEEVETWFLFNVPYAAFGTGAASSADLEVTFQAAGPHMSLAAIAIDTALSNDGYYNEVAPTPEPTSLALLGLGWAALLGKRRSI